MSSIIIYITNSEGTKVPAEVRSCIPEEKLICIYRDFSSARLTPVTFEWNLETKSWRNPDGFLSDYSGGTSAQKEITTRIS